MPMRIRDRVLRKVQQLVETPLEGTGPRVLSAMGLEPLATAFYRRMNQLPRRVRWKLERLFGHSLLETTPRTRRALGIESLEVRLVLSASPLGAEFLANTFTGGAQETFFESSPYVEIAQAVAADADGDFVVAWSSQAQDGDGWGVFAQRFSADGVTQGGELLVNTTTAGDQRGASAAMDAAGNFIVAWSSDGQDGDGWGVFAQRFNADGVAQGGELLINTSTARNQRDASVAMNDDGQFVVSWSSKGQDNGQSWGIYAQQFEATGARLGGELLVNTTTEATQHNSYVAIDGAGNFVVAWDGKGDGDNAGVFAQRYDASGVALGSEFLVSSTVTGEQEHPSVVMDQAGNFVIGYASKGQDGDRWGIYARRYDASGVAQGAEFQVNTTTTGDQQYATLSMDAVGNFFVTWSADGQDGDGWGVYARQYSASGTAVGDEFQVNTTTAGHQWRCSTAMDDTRRLIVVWNGSGAGDDAGVFGQLYDSGDAPAATDDAFTMDEDNTFAVTAIVGLLANDTDAQGSPLSATLVSGPSSGTLVLSGDGSFSYTPDANFSGSDIFSYRAGDGSADSNVATVTITVVAVNDAPVAAGDTFAVDEGNTLIVAAASGLLSNDSDVEQDPLSASLVSGPSNGTLALGSDGSFTYTPDADFSGSDSFSYRTEDAAADSNVATVTITVNVADGGSEPIDFPLVIDDTVLFQKPESPSDASQQREQSSSETAPAYPSDEPAIETGQGDFSGGVSGGGESTHQAVTETDGETDGETSSQSDAESSLPAGAPSSPVDAERIPDQTGASTIPNAPSPPQAESDAAVDSPIDAIFEQLEAAAQDLNLTVPLDWLWDSLDSMQQGMDASQFQRAVDAVMVAGLTTGLSVGYVLWDLRGGSLLSSMMTATPLWKRLDPLDVLTRWDQKPSHARRPGGDRDEPAETLESLLSATVAS